MEIDTGASLSIISEATYLSTWPEGSRPPLRASSAKIRTYSGEALEVRGQIDVSVSYKDHCIELQLLVLSCDGPSLLGRDWLRVLQLDWKELHSIRQQSSAQSLQSLLEKHSGVFKDELGSVKGVQVHIHVKADATPRFLRSRPVPYSLRQKVESELQRLQNEGIIQPVPFSDWAAPIVPVLKRDGAVRICGDYKLTINREAERDVYPLPRVEDLFSSLAEGDAFTKLDLAHAYQQLSLDEESKKYTTINTTRGLFHYNRLPFGVSSAPAVFQRTMENLLQGIPNVCVYLDDVLVTGRSVADHLKNLDDVLSRMESAGIRLKKAKCRFMLPCRSGVLGPQNLETWSTACVGESSCHQGSTCSPKSVAAKVLFGAYQLLQQVPLPFVHDPSSSLPSTPEEVSLDLGSSSAACFSSR